MTGTMEPGHDASAMDTGKSAAVGRIKSMIKGRKKKKAAAGGKGKDMHQMKNGMMMSDAEMRQMMQKGKKMMGKMAGT